MTASLELAIQEFNLDIRLIHVYCGFGVLYILVYRLNCLVNCHCQGMYNKCRRNGLFGKNVNSDYISGVTVFRLSFPLPFPSRAVLHACSFQNYM